MSGFDIYIERINDILEELKNQGRRINVYNVPSSYAELPRTIPVNIGGNANPGIILRQDTYVELGNPEAGSSAFMISTNETGLIDDGRITLIGPDIPESEDKSLPFGQVILIGGAALDDKEHEALQQSGFVGDKIEGYMIRSLPQNIWSRISKDAAGKGFNFECLGKALIYLYKSENPKIESIEIKFITSGKDDVKLLDSISEQVRKISKEIIKENWKIKGYDIDCELDCSSCGDKSVCDDIKDVLKNRKKKGLVK